MNITTDQIGRFLKTQFKSGDVVIKLIFINLAIYLSMKLISLTEWLLRLVDGPVSGFIREWLYLPTQAKELLIKPYTVLSYQFFHDGLLHIFVNVLMLFFFGKMIITQKGFKQVLPIYIMGGVFGGLVFVAFSTLNIIPMMDIPMGGASASIMALMGAVAFLQPNYTIKFFLVFDLKLKWLVAGFALLNLLSIGNPEGAGPGIIHLAGLGFGLGMMFLESKGFSLSKPFNQGVNFILAMFNRKPKPRVSFVNTSEVNEEVTRPTKNLAKQEKIDAILDKISSDGYESLTKAEKDFLFQASKMD